MEFCLWRLGGNVVEGGVKGTLQRPLLCAGLPSRCGAFGDNRRIRFSACGDLDLDIDLDVDLDLDLEAEWGASGFTQQLPTTAPAQDAVLALRSRSR